MQGRLRCGWPVLGSRSRLDANRQLARRMVSAQWSAALLLGLAWWLAKGPHEAIAAASTALAVALGTALLAWRMFGGVVALGRAWSRLVLGMLLKWGVVLATLLVVVGRCKLPPLAALTGLIAAYAAHWWAFRMRVS